MEQFTNSELFVIQTALGFYARATQSRPANELSEILQLKDKVMKMQQDEPDTSDALCSECGESYSPDYQFPRADLCPVCRHESAAHSEFGAYA